MSVRSAGNAGKDMSLFICDSHTAKKHIDKTFIHFRKREQTETSRS